MTVCEMYLRAEIPDAMEDQSPPMTYEERVLASFPPGYFLVPLMQCTRCHEESELLEDEMTDDDIGFRCGACKAYLNL